MTTIRKPCPTCAAPMYREPNDISRCQNRACREYRPRYYLRPVELSQTVDIAEKLLQSSIDLLTQKFGEDYAKKNPHVLSNVLNTHRSVYLSLQEK